MKKVVSIVTIMIIALLVFVGCSPAPENHSIPDWLANKTFSGEVTMTMDGDTNPNTMNMTLKFSEDDCFMSSDTNPNSTSIKGTYGTYGEYEEKSSDNQYSFILPHFSQSTENMTSSGSLSFVIDKVDDITIKMTLTQDIEGTITTPDGFMPLDSHGVMSGTLTME